MKFNFSWSQVKEENYQTLVLLIFIFMLLFKFKKYLKQLQFFPTFISYKILSLNNMMQNSMKNKKVHKILIS